MSEIQRGDLVPAILGGSAANGNERDKGTVVHAVRVLRTDFMDLAATAACGKQYGRKSIGFLARIGAEITCKRCQKEFLKVREYAVCDPYVVRGPSLLEWFATEEEANAWLETKTKEDDGGYAGCLVLPKSLAMQYA